MRHVRIPWFGLVASLVIAVPCLLAPGPCDESFNTVEDDDDGDDDDDDAGDDDATDDDDNDTSDDDTGDDDSGDDDTGSGDDDASGGWLIGQAWVECDDYGDYSEWGFFAQMTGPCDLAGFQIDDGSGPTEDHMMQEGGNFLFSSILSSDWDTAYTCDMSFDIYWWANDLPYEDEAWSSWP